MYNVMVIKDRKATKLMSFASRVNAYNKAMELKKQGIRAYCVKKEERGKQ
jgi:hypothetical protein